MTTLVERQRISIHSLRVEGDRYIEALERLSAISIHSLRVEGDGGDCGMIIKIGIFQSTPSVWRETVTGYIWHGQSQFQSTPSVWRETAAKQRLELAEQFQSTPSVWRETASKAQRAARTSISIHSLRVEGDGDKIRRVQRRGHFNPLPPCGGRRGRQMELSVQLWISIHSLRVEGDEIEIEIE